MSISSVVLNDGNHVPWIAFGTGSAYFGKDATEGIKSAIECGFTHLDSAQLYKNEASLGAGIAAAGKPRSALYITTKLARLEQGETPKTALKKSLKRLGVEYVDLYLIHFPQMHADRLGQVWKGMEETKKAGLARSIGVSNFQPRHLEQILEVATILPAVNQVEAHPYVWKALGPNFAIHKKYGITTSSYGGLSPIVRGKGGPLDPVIEQIRARLETTWRYPVSEGQVVHKWLKQKGVVVVTTSSKTKHMTEYVDTENVPDLTPEEVDLIETTGAKMHRRFYPHSWPEDVDL